MNNDLKELVLVEITNKFDKKIEKNFIFNILNYISNDNNNTITKNNIIFTKNNKNKIIEFVENKEKYNKMNEIKQKYMNLKYYNSNNNANKEHEFNELKTYLSNNEYKYPNGLDIYLEYIAKYISLNIYENIYDFFLSHFVQKKITMESFLNNLEFHFNYTFNKNSKNNIKNNFIDFFKTFTDNELYLFNKAISGSTYNLSNQYIIHIVDENYSKDIFFHTCFNTMDTKYSLFETHYFNNKELFINSELKKNNFTAA